MSTLEGGSQDECFYKGVSQGDGFFFFLGGFAGSAFPKVAVKGGSQGELFRRWF